MPDHIKPKSANSDSFVLEYKIFLEPNEINSTVEKYLAERHANKTPNELSEWIKKSDICIDGEPTQHDALIFSGQTLSINLPHHFEQTVNTDWKPLWQNDEILAVYKPAPLAVSRTTRNLYHTLISLIRRETPYHSAQLLHRLDIETSGIILIAKHKHSDMKWKPLLADLIEKKVYHAIVTGKPDWQTRLCENELAERYDSEIRCKMYVVDSSEPREHYKKPKACKSHFKLIKTQGNYSLIECTLFTGRKHQIRAHLADLGLPIVGDKIYSHQGQFFIKRLESENGLSTDDYHKLGAKSHLLRAVHLTLNLQDNQELITIDYPSFNDDLTKECHI